MKKLITIFFIVIISGQTIIAQDVQIVDAKTIVSVADGDSPYISENGLLVTTIDNDNNYGLSVFFSKNSLDPILLFFYLKEIQGYTLDDFHISFAKLRGLQKYFVFNAVMTYDDKYVDVFILSLIYSDFGLLEVITKEPTPNKFSIKYINN